MEYNAAGDILRKNQLHQRKGIDADEWSPQHKTTHDFEYKYEGKQPHTLTNVTNSVGPNAGGKTYSYDANGNTTGYVDDQNSQERKMLWDEENRLVAIADQGKMHHYIYDAGGQRTIKAKGDGLLVNINGVNTGGNGTVDNYTMYVYPHFTVHNNKYTKHFFVGSQRILSKLGAPGTLDDVAVIQKVNGNGKIDYNLKQDATNEHIQGHYKWVGEDGVVMTAGKSGKVPPGILKKYEDIPEDSISNGNNDKYERNQYFFHPDHLGNTSFITDANGEVSQHTEYLPFGEILVDDRPVNDKNPYLYNGKELDEETGLYYYGARFYDAQLARFHSIDPLAEEFVYQSPYLYAGNNPIKYIDVNGEFKLPADFINKYPKTAAYLNAKFSNLYKKGNITEMLNSERVVSALINNSEGNLSSKTQITKHFFEGFGPQINDAEGDYSYQAEGTIYLGDKMLLAFENATGDDEQAALTWLVSTILHEYLEEYTDDRLDDGTGCIPMEDEIFGEHPRDIMEGHEVIKNATNGKKDELGRVIIPADESVLPTVPQKEYESNKKELSKESKTWN